ncbi:hypothetical protein CMO83_01505 [Candidatus Woesearchaeota archaeon]|jgi:hypothetical protein|nr:hypothetical protein [Candidatus Woesearchaeota archaeon]MDP6647990.1 hypothetical protein [Candidatus Woesearchaeota archaeon]|tara:strand:- start:27382 stop:29052 length:1671 start_codon:yes stop_codon:yes gene_type:complete
MKKEVVYFLLFILLSQFVAAATEIFSGKVITDADVSADGLIFKFKYDQNLNKAFAQTPTTNMIIDNGACKSNIEYRVCINGANFSHKNITTYVFYYEVDVTISKLTGSLSVDSKVKSGTLLQGESTDLTITLTNPTNLEVTSINYNLDLSSFIIKEVKGCTFNGYQLAWKGFLKPNYDHTCTATVIADNGGTYSLAGNITYFNGVESVQETTPSVAITVLQKQLEINQIIDSYIEVNHPFYYNLSLKNNNEDEDISPFITLELPRHIVVLKDKSGFTNSNNNLKKNLILKPETGKNFSLLLEARAGGGYILKQDFDYTIKNLRNSIQNSTVIDAVDPKPLINLTTEYSELLPGQKFIVIVKISNPSKFFDFTDVKSRLNVPYNMEVQQDLAKIKPNQSYIAMSNNFIVPKDLTSINEDILKIYVTADYTINGGQKSINHTKDIKLKLSAPPSSGTESIKSEVQSSQDTETEETIIGLSEPEDESEEEITTIVEDLTPEKSKLDLLNRKLLLLVAIIFIALFLVPFIIYKIRKRKKQAQQQENLLNVGETDNKPKDI